MTKAGFVNLAAILKRQWAGCPQGYSESEVAERVGFRCAVDALCRGLSQENPRFNNETFLAAIFG